MKTLSREVLTSTGHPAMLPHPDLLDLPEKAVQFGTGGLLRGLVDFFLDEANRQGLFGGRVVAIGSTGSGRDQRLNEQDGLFTLAVQGLQGGAAREELRVIASVSRGLSAQDEWDAVLACARTEALELVVSNTTEVGIVLDDGDSAHLSPPRSFPGKLTRFLYERARTFNYGRERGVVVLPTELVENNGERLRQIVLALARRWELGDEFVRWVEEAVPFCNTLVDRIVPGTPQPARRAELEERLGYQDALLTECEIYRLFAIEADDDVRRRLGFAAADPGVVVADDITPYRDRKVRLLNGAHTLVVTPALLAGCTSVLDATRHPLVGAFLRDLLLEELVPALDMPSGEAFAREVLERFANPFIHHALWGITLHGTTKMRVRVVPSILGFAERTGRAPASVALGFAAFLLFMRGDLHEERRAQGRRPPGDDHADYFRALWRSLVAKDDEAGLERLVRTVCANAELWGVDLGQVPGFVAAVTGHLVCAHRDGIDHALEIHSASRASAS